MIRSLICLEWNTSTEDHFGSELDAALAFEMTSSCSKNAGILGGEICGFDCFLLNYLGSLRKALQRKERQRPPNMKIEQVPLPSCYPVTFQVH